MRTIIQYGTLLVVFVALIGCFNRPDIGRMRVDDDGTEIVENFKNRAKPGEAGFVGPVAPAPAESFSEGKADKDSR